jgi:hypothetical protein
VPVVLRLPLGHSHSYGFLLTHSTANRACELWQSRCFAPPAPSGNRRRSSAIPPSRPGLRGPPRRPVHRAFFLASRIEEAPHAPRVGAGAAPPPKSPPRPASGSHRLPHTHTHTHWVRLVSNMGHRPRHLGVLGAYFYHFQGHIPQAGQRAGRTTANFRVSDLTVALQHLYWTYLMDFGRWTGPLGGPIFARQSLVLHSGELRGLILHFTFYIFLHLLHAIYNSKFLLHMTSMTLGRISLEIVDERKQRLSGCTRCDQIRQELHADSFLGVRASV